MTHSPARATAEPRSRERMSSDMCSKPLLSLLYQAPYVTLSARTGVFLSILKAPSGDSDIVFSYFGIKLFT